MHRLEKSMQCAFHFSMSVPLLRYACEFFANGLKIVGWRRVGDPRYDKSKTEVERLGRWGRKRYFGSEIKGCSCFRAEIRSCLRPRNRGNSNGKQIRGPKRRVPTNGNGKSFRRQKTNDSRFPRFAKTVRSTFSLRLFDSHGYSRLRFSKFQAFKWMKRGWVYSRSETSSKIWNFIDSDWCWDLLFPSLKCVAKLWQVF